MSHKSRHFVADPHQILVQKQITLEPPRRYRSTAVLPITTTISTSLRINININIINSTPPSSSLSNQNQRCLLQSQGAGNGTGSARRNRRTGCSWRSGKGCSSRNHGHYIALKLESSRTRGVIKETELYDAHIIVVSLAFTYNHCQQSIRHTSANFQTADKSKSTRLMPKYKNSKTQV
jgi:hypothetical protein